MNIKSIVEKRLSAVWDKYKNLETTRIPALSVDEVPEDAIVFIGINPSIDEKELQRLKEAKNSNVEFYRHLPQRDNNHKYFYKFVDIAELIGVAWGHIDLLYIRERKQNLIKKMISDDVERPFLWEQLQIAKDVIENIIDQANPQAFVVNNTLARQFLGKDREGDENAWLGFDFEWDEKIGTYRYKGIPFFFTSMLTGQRALDNGSYERLVWQIKSVLGKEETDKYRERFNLKLKK